MKFGNRDGNPGLPGLHKKKKQHPLLNPPGQVCEVWGSGETGPNPFSFPVPVPVGARAIVVFVRYIRAAAFARDKRVPETR